MGKRISVEMFDDLEPELAADVTIEFAFEGVGYQIDLSSKNADRFRKELAPWIQAATATSGREVRPDAKPRTPSGQAGLPRTEIRAWARANGYPVSDRGNVSAAVVRAWKSATAHDIRGEVACADE
ncbi:histone-like nucleoid-structuring protein Lsr2 [Mycolicibacterium fortuitum]|jgi:hypothetical protein|uniref:DNA-bridging protein Lsr2 n=3 Tax=Mycolicibacterium fortuitum TaxID=1766 RepID=A0A1A0R3J8_MYCFO|nr:Lsr2 family protein [Mycolicibacterium fortuitum]AJR30345.1 Histone protein Lsr2 [Mycobacterium sp. VKM Ac-1817D]AMD56242.1 hypothetical protein ATO49_28615 [Mycolicibacterium fortuitum subsp. fortuitum DSM 46621 = ATCC 6841 = JCM 6387]EJZ13932.1 LSR2-like protein [Mycolicibacterium fortuitum subsp. fortuitum DSM 46621 = ATCC 6841 = JCM 6387]MCA4756220.1 Lsr2 family protein [Mycolicibacterium fortuitum]MCV7143228.1 Lsr2 family protein [Mycolicibacterium fortuitum]